MISILVHSIMISILVHSIMISRILRLKASIQKHGNIIPFIGKQVPRRHKGAPSDHTDLIKGKLILELLIKLF